MAKNNFHHHNQPPSANGLRHYSNEAIEELWAGDNEHLFHPWEFMEFVGENKRSMIEKGEGIYVYDQFGKKLLDAPSGMWCVNIGHGRQEMADAIAAQAKKLAYYSPFANANPVAVEFAKKVAQYAPADLTRIFFTNSGSEAVDSAIRFMQFYHNLIGKPEKKKIIARYKGYHGSTYLCQGISGRERDRSYMDSALHLTHFISSPNLYFKPSQQSEAEFLQEKIIELELLIEQQGADKIGAFIAEPIQASGGVIVPPKGYLKACRQICKNHEILYISDEVVTGFGRMGHVVASEDYFGITPDMITMAKGITSGYIPMGALLISEKLFGRIAGAKNIGGQLKAIFSNGYTCSGHAVGAAAGLKNLEIIEREKILDNVKTVGPYFQKRLRELLDLPIVGDVRGEMLMGCIEMVADKKSDKDNNDLLQLDRHVGNRVDAHCQELGLIVRPIINLCVMSPPLTITKEQVDELIEKLQLGVKRTMSDLKQEGILV